MDDRSPIRLALVDDYDIVLAGVAHMFENYTDRIAVVELDANRPVEEDVDIALYDTFAQPEVDHVDIETLLQNPRAGRVVVYTWNFGDDLVDTALAKGASGYLSKTLPARELVAALEAINGGETVVSAPPPRRHVSSGLDWPGRTEGLSAREAEILALITQGRSNVEISDVMFLSGNTIKTYIRSLYRKIGAGNRVDAVLWGIDHGFTPDHHRIEGWRLVTR